MTKLAIATLVVGKFHEDIFEITKPYFERYCQKLGIDFIVIHTERINGYAANLEKFQLYDYYDKYDRIAFIDCDVLIHPESPDIFSIVPSEFIGAVYDNRHNDPNMLHERNMEEINEVQNKLGKIDGWKTEYVNSGVLITSKCHRNIFTNAEYRTRFESRYKDQTLINWNIHKHGYFIYRLESKFNAMGVNGHPMGKLQYGIAQEPFINAYFLHFAGAPKKLLTVKNTSNLINKQFNLNIPHADIDVFDFKESDIDDAYFDIGEIGWSQYIAGHVRYLAEVKKRKVAVVCHPHKRVLYRQSATLVLPIPDEWNKKFSHTEVEGFHLYNPENNTKMTNLQNISKLIREAYPGLPFRFNYSKWVDSRIMAPYFHKPEILDEAKIDGDCIIIFPRWRPSKFASRNIKKEIWISMVNKICERYPHMKIVSVGSPGGSLTLNGIINHANFIDLVPYDNLKTLDILVGLCNTGQAKVTFGNVTGPIKMAMVCGTPSFIFGYKKERNRLTREENYCNVDCGYYDCYFPPNGNELKDSFDVNENELLLQTFKFFERYI